MSQPAKGKKDQQNSSRKNESFYVYFYGLRETREENRDGVTQKRLEYDANAFIGFIVSYDEWHLHIQIKKEKLSISLSVWDCSIHQAR